MEVQVTKYTPNYTESSYSEVYTDADLVFRAANLTQNFKYNRPTANFLRKMLKAEHSPIRMLQYWVSMRVPQWVTTHLDRHHIGVQPYQGTSRPDLLGLDPYAQRPSQDAIVPFGMLLNAQAVINISRKRLCNKTHPTTKMYWKEVVRQVENLTPEFKTPTTLLVPECVYRGFCPEMQSCNYYKTEQFKSEREAYLNG